MNQAELGRRLRQQRNNFWDAAAAIITVAGREGRELTQAESCQFGWLMRELRRMDEPQPADGIGFVFRDGNGGEL